MNMGRITGKQITKSIVFTVLGATPGVVWFLNAGTTQSVVIACLGTFIGFGLSLPGVSVARVAGGTAGMIIANNAPRSMQGKIMDTFTGGTEPDEIQEDSSEEETQHGERRESWKEVAWPN
jgi:hypothetical protein